MPLHDALLGGALALVDPSSPRPQRRWSPPVVLRCRVAGAACRQELHSIVMTMIIAEKGWCAFKENMTMLLPLDALQVMLTRTGLMITVSERKTRGRSRNWESIPRVLLHDAKVTVIKVNAQTD